MKISVNADNIVVSYGDTAPDSMNGVSLQVYGLTEAQENELLVALQGAGRVFFDGVNFSKLQPVENPIANIGAIEQSNPITHRALRELILTIGEIYPAGKNTVFYQRVLAAEQAIQVERAKL